MITYTLMLSQRFPAKHPRKGELTEFATKVKNAMTCITCATICSCVCDPDCQYYKKAKFHTIRANYDLWQKRFEKIKAGKACLSIRQWEGVPYKSKQIEIARLTREDGIGLQSLHLYKENETPIGEVNVKFDSETSVKGLAYNEGLELNDWYSWFENYDFSKTLAIIHFTKIRY